MIQLPMLKGLIFKMETQEVDVDLFIPVILHVTIYIMVDGCILYIQKKIYVVNWFKSQ